MDSVVLVGTDSVMAGEAVLGTGVCRSDLGCHSDLECPLDSGCRLAMECRLDLEVCHMDMECLVLA